MALEQTLTAIRPRTDGEGVDFILREADGKETCLPLPDGSYLEWRSRIGCVMTAEEVSYLEAEAVCFAAYRKGADLLDLGDMTAAALVRKLRMRGFPSPAATRAAARLAEVGAINEPQLARQAVRYYIEKKNYGRSRIVSEMYAKGFARETVDEALSHVDDDAFVAACRAQIARRYGGALPDDRDEQRRAVAALYRYGFTRSEITAALK